MIRRSRAAIVALLITLAPTLAGADEDEGKKHFMTGVKLFQLANHAGALAEFEEAYRQHPTANALQNIALCQKALFRYAEATATLERMLREYGPTLGDTDRKAADAALAELRQLVVRVTLAISPPDATVTVDGRPLDGGAERTVSLNVGEHTIHVEAPFHRAIDRTDRLASGAHRIEVALVAESGKLSVTAEPDAAISVDGAVRGYGTWSGDVSAGKDHAIQVFKPGFRTRDLNVRLATGESLPLSVPKLEKYDGDAPPTPLPYTPPVSPRRGPYVMLTAASYYLMGDPDGFELLSNRVATRFGAFAGGRIGYRVASQVGLEIAGEYGGHDIGPGCYAAQRSCTALAQNKPTYELNSLRVGLNARYFIPLTRSGATSLVGIAGIGYAHHSVTLPPPEVVQTPPYPEGNTTGGNFYGTLEAGIQFSLSSVLIEPVITSVIQGVSDLKAGVTKSGYAPQRVYTDDSNLILIGGGIRVGYAFYLPSRRGGLTRRKRKLKARDRSEERVG